MKFKNIFLATLVTLGASSCNDFLKVDAVSKYDNEYVFSDKTEVNRALNGVYAQLLSNSMYGNAYLTTFCLNSDVDMNISSNDQSIDNGYRRFDCTSLGSDINSFWTAAYKGVEYANNFIYNLEHSALFNSEDSDVMQMWGEAKVMRAMFYHDLMVMFGDIPFTLTPNYEADSFIMPVVNREEIYTQLIDDLTSVAPHMQFATNLSAGVERVSKEFCWSMIARMALTCGGYSLRPVDGSTTSYGTMMRPTNYQAYYQTARAYCDSVISSGTHALNLPYNQVFINQCNYTVVNNDDPIFEIPFAKNNSGRVGYSHGPRGEVYEGLSTHVWGESDGGARLSAFYRFSFDEEDVRRDYVNGMWYYLFDGTPTIRTDYTVHNNKWSKFWASSGSAMGADSKDNTGFNFPYMRYTDVLLMYAEAVNELENGVGGEHGAKAIEAVRQVRARAIADAGKVDAYLSAAAGSKESFLQAVLDERKWEFAGENMRWKDLVRNNLYSESIYYSFMRYYAVGSQAGGDFSYTDMVEAYDGKEEYLANLPLDIYYTIEENPGNINSYPNTTLRVLNLINPYETITNPGGVLSASFYGWWNEADGAPRDQCLFSFYGFIRGDRFGSIYLIRDGSLVNQSGPNNLPVVRYILPYPNAAIQRSAGLYKNQYGYTR